MGKADLSSTYHNNRTICLPISQEEYDAIVGDPQNFRKWIDARFELFSELFPSEIANGYRMKDFYFSKKLSIWIRRIKIAGVAYTIRPSFAMPYMTAIVDEVEKGLFLRKFGVPFWALSHIFGRDPMYWYRIEQTLGRNSIVGTTIRNSDDIPFHLSADEKHTRILGNKTYIATTVGDQCILGASIAKNAREDGLKDAYQVFKDEAQCIKPDYAPDTINIDGWKATHNVWALLFPSAVIIYCFLHVFIKVRDRGKKKYKDIFEKIADKLWKCYRANTKRSFSQRIRRVIEWCKKNDVPSTLSKPIKKLKQNISGYSPTYDFPEAQRTSNMIDRLMRRMDRHLFTTQYFHGAFQAAELSIRGWALIQNFAPWNPRTVKINDGFQSPAERFNKFQYHKNWLQNLLIAASLGGYRSPPQNPL
jgi:hypothetical protein